MKRGISIIIVIIILIFLGIFIGWMIAKNQKTVETISNDTNEVAQENKIEENIITGNKEDEEKKEEKETEEEKPKKESTDQTPEEKAIEIVKENWGEDDSVYFYCEEKVKDGKYKRKISSCC